jgi:histidine triad (HIT) family protein
MGGRERLSGRYRGDMSCVFCAIVAGDAPAVLVHEEDDYLAFLDIRPIVRGHTLVIPKRHTTDLTDTPPETVGDMMRIGQRVGRAARASDLRADGNNIALNDGRAAFQSVFHVHLHVAPRHDGDKLSFAKGLVVRRDPDREATGAMLRAALAALPD